ncbi:MAG: hypothetical protein E7609_00045 [Ruminococcaceae bacterium]|nr:hypothetical protein [Oscillospiraceae bacterium]
MKYRVVGWTDYDSDIVPEARGRIGYAECCAVIDEIKKHGYLFSGWDHQECLYCVPVLNDGKKRCFSQRGWGGIMAEAYGYTDPYDYSLFTFYESIDPEKVKKPSASFNPGTFTPETDLNERFLLTANEFFFRHADANNPFCIDDTEAFRFIDAGDTLTLCYANEEIDFFVTEIDRTHRTIGRTDAARADIKGKILVSFDPTKITKR